MLEKPFWFFTIFYPACCCYSFLLFVVVFNVILYFGATACWLIWNFCSTNKYRFGVCVCVCLFLFLIIIPYPYKGINQVLIFSHLFCVRRRLYRSLVMCVLFEIKCIIKIYYVSSTKSSNEKARVKIFFEGN